MDKELWERISENYKIAEQYIWPSEYNNWQSDEDKGMYHLWHAYYMAKNAEEKDELLYARILQKMERVLRYGKSDYELFHKYIAPAQKAYDKAIAHGDEVDDKELNEARNYYESLKYLIEQNRINDDLEACKDYQLIPGLNDIRNLRFHDSKPIYFEHNDTTALLKIDFGEVIVTFKFDDIYDIVVNCDPMINYVDDAYCYRKFECDNIIVFDIGWYKITCARIEIADVSRQSE